MKLPNPRFDALIQDPVSSEVKLGDLWKEPKVWAQDEVTTAGSCSSSLCGSCRTFHKDDEDIASTQSLTETDLSGDAEHISEAETDDDDGDDDDVEHAWNKSWVVGDAADLFDFSFGCYNQAFKYKDDVGGWLPDRGRRSFKKEAQKKIKRSYRIRPALLQAVVPSAAELKVGSEFLAACHEDRHETKESEEGTLRMKSKQKLERVRGAFYNKHWANLKLSGIGALRLAPMHCDVMETFLSVLELYGQEALVLCYHGTAERNLNSIFERGLLTGGRHKNVRIQHGAAYGSGIYVAKEDNHQMSMAYTHGSTKLLVCGVVDSTRVPSPTERDQDDVRVCSVNGKRKESKYTSRGGITCAHREHRKHAAQPPKGSQRISRKMRSSNMSKNDDSLKDDNVVNYPGFMVVRNENHVMPLFVADRTEPWCDDYIWEGLHKPDRCPTDYEDPALFHICNNRVSSLRRAGRQQVLHEGSVLWLTTGERPSKLVREVKRRYVKRLQTRARAEQRHAKEEMLKEFNR